MESRGEPADHRTPGRPAISRRSCDHCRLRKVGCDRGSPCGNCVSARIECVYSTIASNTTPLKQRVLISAKYEQKIDGIAKDIDGIKALLQGSILSKGEQNRITDSARYSSNRTRSNDALDTEPRWGHSARIIDFVRAVCRDSDFYDDEGGEVVSSLKSLLEVLENPSKARKQSLAEIERPSKAANGVPPTLEAVLDILRWAKDHRSNTRIAWMSHILSTEMFTEICRDAFFAVDDREAIDQLIADCYLSYIFFEHVIISNRKDYMEHCRSCRVRFEEALAQLPFLLAPSLKAIAALTLGAYNAIENSKGSAAWNFISAAANMCQTLGYHRHQHQEDKSGSQKAAQTRLFWTVYRLERSISTRLHRASNIRDAEITLEVPSDESTGVQHARLQGKVYDQLYSPASLGRPDHERTAIAILFAQETRDRIRRTQHEIDEVLKQLDDRTSDPMRALYIRCELICQLSLLCLILRANSEAGSSVNGVSDECVEAARTIFDIHGHCMMDVRSGNNTSFMTKRYINWVIVHSPLEAFSILFMHAIQTLDVTQLGRLDRFVESLRPEEGASESITHPYRLYRILCQAAWLCFSAKSVHNHGYPASMPNLLSPLDEFDIAQVDLDATASDSSITQSRTMISATTEAEDAQNCGLGEWYQGNQQLMYLLDENMLF